MAHKANAHSGASPIRMGSAQSASGVLQRKCACGAAAGTSGECEECQKKSTLQRRATGAAEPAAVPPIVHDVLQSPGQPLDPASRAFFEPRFGHDFSKVRVHTDTRAAQSARAINAAAYTVGPQVVSRKGNTRQTQEPDAHSWHTS